MKSIIDILNEDKMSLIVSLPENNIDLAKAAIDGGADALKIHVNVEHRASGSEFKSIGIEMVRIEPILSLCKESNIPLGIVAGSSDSIPEKEINQIVNLGFDFISLYDRHMDPVVLNEKNIYKMIAIDNNFKFEWVKTFDSLPVDIIECSIMEPSTYGEPLTVREIFQYKSIRDNTNLPLVVPTQRNIKLEQTSILNSIGINGIMIGAIVTGRDAKTLFNTTSEFRKELDKTT